MTSPPTIEVIEPLVRAWGRTRRLLFEPFLFERWAIFGFSAWLAYWTGTGGGGGNLGWLVSPPSNLPEPISATREQFSDWFFGTAMVVVATIFFVAFAFGLLRVWLQSRFDFVFLSHLTGGGTAIAHPWREHARLGHSLFGWRLILGLGFLTVLSLPVLLAISAGLQPGVMSIGSLVAAALLLVPVVIAGLLLIFAINQFVVPIMLARNETFLPALARFRELLASSPGPFLFYTLLYVVLSVAVGMAITAIGFATCCIGFLLVGLPYVGAVVLLPIAVCARYYSLEFLRQFGADIDLLSQLEAPATVPPPS